MKHALLFTCVLVACSYETHHTIDAQPRDASVDTLQPNDAEPPAEAVKLAVTRAGVPVANVAVFFQDMSSTEIGASVTNENGVAWALMPAGGYVTALENAGAGLDELTTFAGVSPGDALRLDHEPAGDTRQWTFEASFAPDSLSPASYTLATSCSDPLGIVDPQPSASSPPNVITLVGCNGIVDIAIVAYDIEGNPTGRVLYAPSVDVRAGGAITIPGSFATLQLRGLNLTNVPAEVASVGIDRLVSAERPVYTVSDNATPSANVIDVSHLLPTSATSELTRLTMWPVSGERGQQFIYASHGSSPYALDVGSSLLPAYVTDAPEQPVATFDVVSRSVQWHERQGATQPDLVRARIDVSRAGFPSGRAWHWRIIAPRTGTRVDYPQLPVLDFDFNAKTDDTIVVPELTTAQLPGGFVAWHANGFGDLRGATGKIVVQMLYVPEL
jgi:hypothetical protein